MQRDCSDFPLVASNHCNRGNKRHSNNNRPRITISVGKMTTTTSTAITIKEKKRQGKRQDVGAESGEVRVTRAGPNNVQDLDLSFDTAVFAGSAFRTH